MSNLMPEPARISLAKRGQWSRLRGTLQAAAFIIGSLLLSLGLVRLLFLFEGYLKRPLEDFALYAYLVVFIVSMLSSATIIFPAPGVAILMAAAARWNPAWVALAASVGGTLGEVTAYYVGYWGSGVISRARSEAYERATVWMRRYGWVALSVFAFVPFFIFDLVGIAAGALRFPLWKFFLACYAGRLPRAFLEAYLGFQLFPFIFPTLFH
ncbi:YqaA family protein [Chloroflexota bacterium]